MYLHPFHLVSPSPWPLATALSALLLASGFLLSLHSFSSAPLVIGIICLLSCSWFWVSNIILEGIVIGFHTVAVCSSIRIGFLLFIVSEVFLFFCFFWAYLHFALSPAIEVGSIWPPTGITPIPFANVPLLNTCILLFSGLLLTWSHSCLLTNSTYSCLLLLSLTILMGCFFGVLQIWEFHAASFCISDSSYGSSFYILTGLHGLHVFAGSVFLVVISCRLFKGHFLSSSHVGFILAAWYWHFVDVVWLLLFFILYIWGS